jgi:hypothetical protein
VFLLLVLLRFGFGLFLLSFALIFSGFWFGFLWFCSTPKQGLNRGVVGQKRKGGKKWLKAKQGKGYSLLKAIVNNFFLK